MRGRRRGPTAWAPAQAASSTRRNPARQASIRLSRDRTAASRSPFPSLLRSIVTASRQVYTCRAATALYEEGPCVKLLCSCIAQSVDGNLVVAELPGPRASERLTGHV